MFFFFFGPFRVPFRPFPSSDAKALEISGHDIFSDEAAQSRTQLQMSQTKAAHLQGHDVFGDDADAFVPGKAQSEAKMKRDMYANNVFSDAAEPHRPSTAQSRAKAEEISGHDIFSDGDGFRAGDKSESRTARHAATSALSATGGGRGLRLCERRRMPFLEVPLQALLRAL